MLHQVRVASCREHASWPLRVCFADGAKRSPRVESRWQFWRQSTEAAATPLSPRTEVSL